ncbi:MAG: DUF3817 domain-containing protein [Nocardioides sp.]
MTAETAAARTTPTGPWAKAFRVAALVEALTWCGLLIGMAFKYVIADNEIGVQIFGPIHGAAFIAYVITTTIAARTFGWSWKIFGLGLVCSIPPLATWAFERYVDRTGLLSPSSPQTDQV